jgi:hypothetical protein
MSVIGISQDQSKVVQIVSPLAAILNNGSGVATGAPISLALGANTVTLTKAGTVIINVPAGYAGTAATGTMAVSGSPVTLVPGANVITTTGPVGNITVTITCTTTQTVIEVVGLRTILAVIGASLTGGYKLDPAAVTIAGNDVTIQPRYYAYNTKPGGVDGPAIAVPNTVDLSAIICNLTVVGY